MGGRERARSRARERLDALAGATLAPDEACLTAIALLRPAVAFERWCWPRTDPASTLSTGGIAEFDLWAELPRIAALEEHGDVTSKPRLARARRPSASLSGATHGDLARSVRWRECLAPYGVGDELMTVCRDRHGAWGSVELMRDAGDPPFDDDDVELLGRLSSTLGRLLRRSQPQARQPGGAPQIPPATLILDRTLQPTSWTASFRDWLGELSADGMLPPAVFELGARVLTPAADATGLPAVVRLRSGGGRWVTLEAAELHGTAARGDVAITIRDSSAAEIFDLLALTYDLTARERQLVSLVLAGLATKQLAAALCISEYTVQDHLKAVFAKTGLRSRRELISHLAGRAAA